MMKQLKIYTQITPRDCDSLKTYFSEVSKIQLLTVKEEEELAIRSKDGDTKALEKLVLANLRFVVSVAKQYQHKGLPLSELIEEGNLGLIKAVQKFDVNKGFKFITYAVWWIRQSILQAITDHSKVVRIPVNHFTAMNKISEASSILQKTLEREPTTYEISEALDQKESRVKGFLYSNQRSVSIDAPITDNCEITYLDVLPIENQKEDVENKINNELFQDDIKKAIGQLKFREQQIICKYFGIMGNSSMTLEEIGEYFELTRERVRQIKERALRTLRMKGSGEILRRHFSK